MSTKLYLHAALFDTATYPGDYPINQTGGTHPALQGGFNLQIYSAEPYDVPSTHRSMNKTIGSSQTGGSLTSSSATTRSYYVTKFISDPLKAQTINTNTWKYNCGYAESSFAVNCLGYTPPMLYVWRPSGGGSLVGKVIDNEAVSGFAEPSAINTIKLNKLTINATQNVTVQEGDVLILEVWYRYTMSNSTPATSSIYYDGSTDYDTGTANDTVSDIASFIETPQDLEFVTDTPQEINAISDYKDILVSRPVVKV